MAKYKQVFQRDVVDPETGEVVTIDSTKVFTEKIQDDDFYMVFIDYISPLFGLKPEGAKSLLTWMCQHAQFNTGYVSITTNDRKRLTKELNITNSSISNYLTVLKKVKLISGENGSYMINPQIFWKGSREVRGNLLKNKTLRITFGLETDEDNQDKNK